MSFKQNLIALNTYRKPTSLAIATNHSNPSERRVVGVMELREKVRALGDIPALAPEIEYLKQSAIFQTASDETFVNAERANQILESAHTLDQKIETLAKFWDDIAPSRDDGLDILLPDLTNFSDFESVARDLKVAIESSLGHSGIEHSIQIVSAEPGSIWLTVLLGSTAAVTFIGRLVSLALKLNQKWIEQRNFIEYGRSIKLGNQILEQLKEQADQAHHLYLTSLTEEIRNGAGVRISPEIENHYKLAIGTIADLLKNNAKFLPQSSRQEVKDSFPKDEGVIALTRPPIQISNQ